MNQLILRVITNHGFAKMVCVITYWRFCGELAMGLVLQIKNKKIRFRLQKKVRVNFHFQVGNLEGMVEKNLFFH